MYSPPSSPVSPTRPQRVIPHGFLAPPKPKHRSVQEMSIRELHDRYDNNAKLLASPCVLSLSFDPFVDIPVFRGVSTSNYIHRISAEQLEIQALLAELEGVDKINTGMRNARIKGEDEMDVEMAPEPPVSRIIETKRRVLARRYVRAVIISCIFTCSDQFRRVLRKVHPRWVLSIWTKLLKLSNAGMLLTWSAVKG